MRSFILLLTALLTLSYSIAQEVEESDVELPDDYYKPIPKAKVLAFSLPQITINKLKNFTPFKDIYYQSPVSKIESDKLAGKRSGARLKEGTSEIYKQYVIKKGSFNGKQAILYFDYKYDSEGEGIWLALYNNKQKRWQKYYTGIAQGEPLYLKWDSSLPLFRNSNHIQIEAAYLRTVYVNGSPFVETELVQDGVVVTFDINRIIADTDKDGLTDVIEAKMLLNPNLKDTDKDGLEDSVDPNPRFNLPRTEYSHIYETLLSGILSLDRKFIPIPFMPLKYVMVAIKSPDNVRTNIIISDSKDIQGIHLYTERLIILTNKEFETHKYLYPSQFKEIYLSPFIKADNNKNAYLVSVSDGPGGNGFLVRKGKNGWEYRVETSWME